MVSDTIFPHQRRSKVQISVMENILEVGHVKFWLHHGNPNWILDDRVYSFSPISENGISVAASKVPNRKIQLVISGPYHQSFSFVGPIPLSDVPAVMVVFTWERENIKLYLNAEVAAEMQVSLIDKSKVVLLLESPGESVSLQDVGEVLIHFGNLLSGVSAFINSKDNLSILTSIEDMLDKNKFEIVSAERGSFRAILSGSKIVFDFLKKHLHTLLILIHGHTKEYADALLEEKKAIASIATSNARKSDLEVLRVANEVCIEISRGLEIYGHNLPPEVREKLISSAISKPLESLSKSLIKNHLIMSLKDHSADKK